MSTSVVKCGIFQSDGFNSVVTRMGRIICTNCGQEIGGSTTRERDLKDHIFYEFIGAYCHLDKMIHYRWIPANWNLLSTRILQNKESTQIIISPVKTDFGLEKYFKRNLEWVYDTQCKVPEFVEVLWNDFEQSKLILLRPADTGFHKSNQTGMYAPFIAALIEWLLHKEQWEELATYIANSMMSAREKTSLHKAVVDPTASNIFKMLWTFRRFIPGWNNKRSLGRRSPSSLVTDEIRWTTNYLDNLPQVDRDRLIKYGPEPDSWGTWPELWPDPENLDFSLNEFGPNLKYLGIHYGTHLSILENPNVKSGERSWMEIADRLIHWPIKYYQDGSIDLNQSIRGEIGFVSKLRGNLSIALQSAKVTQPSKWRNYLVAQLPLGWIMDENNSQVIFSTKADIISIDELQDTLIVIQPWIDGKTELQVKFKIQGGLDDQLTIRIESFKRRISGTNISLITDQD